MNNSSPLIFSLSSIRNQYGLNYSSQKQELLTQLLNISSIQAPQSAIQELYHTLLFLIAYPNDKTIHQLAEKELLQLADNIQANERIKTSVFNSGVTGSSLCAAFSFEIVKWLRATQRENIILASLEADDSQIQNILSVVMPKVESEILQDANANWKTWFKRTMIKGEEMLDHFIAIFDQSDLRPEVKDELWNAIGINIEISLPIHTALPISLVKQYYHGSLLKKNFSRQLLAVTPPKTPITEKEAAQIIECSRMILVRHLREIDPITFTAPKLVSYYQLPRGLSVALMEMTPERRHPIDSYMGYVAFKNGLPVAYAGSWLLFDSGRIGLNVFPAYRGGESQYIFEQVLQLHRRVYRLNRFSVDPYQIGKENHDGIKSGAFFTYHHAGFRPIRKQQADLAAKEALKIITIKGYRTPASALRKLAESRLELVLQQKAVRFDVTDLSIAYTAILKKQYNNNRQQAEQQAFNKLTKLLQLKDVYEPKLKFILANWSILLMSREAELQHNSPLKKILRKLFILKASGSEVDYHFALQKSVALRKLFEGIVKEYC